ncbi:TRAP transporter small permease [Aquisalimonas lutea]|uniref:TRAP transporter small permease subunit n=1 Tax=Aquisalimonas lutea TaxID=1327750 RepID=UPI0025B36DA9|nr:TRAP transporter small permease [Aquisalimonas lutea]MDN3516366.1 TRAP transporter small permease [Aquisalimonas lutea]
MRGEADNAAGGAEGPSRPQPLAIRAWGWVVDGLAVLGTGMIGVLMAIICADILARNLLGGSLPLVSEFGALALVMIVYLQLATTIRHRRLVRSDILLNLLDAPAPRLRMVLECLFDLVGAVVIAVIAWSTLGMLERDIAVGQYIGVTGVLILPTWPFRALILLGAGVAALQFVFQLAYRLRLVAAGKGQTP